MELALAMEHVNVMLDLIVLTVQHVAQIIMDIQNVTVCICPFFFKMVMWGTSCRLHQGIQLQCSRSLRWKWRVPMRRWIYWF